MVYDPDHPEAELVWRDGQVQLDILCFISTFVFIPLVSQIIELEKSQDETEETEV